MRRVHKLVAGLVFLALVLTGLPGCGKDKPPSCEKTAALPASLQTRQTKEAMVITGGSGTLIGDLSNCSISIQGGNVTLGEETGLLYPGKVSLTGGDVTIVNTATDIPIRIGASYQGRITVEQIDSPDVAFLIFEEASITATAHISGPSQYPNSIMVEQAKFQVEDDGAVFIFTDESLILRGGVQFTTEKGAITIDVKDGASVELKAGGMYLFPEASVKESRVFIWDARFPACPSTVENLGGWPTPGKPVLIKGILYSFGEVHITSC